MKRRIRFLGLLWILVACAIPAWAGGWGVSRGSAGLTGYTAEELPDAPKVLWTARVGAYVPAEPVVATGRVFVMADESVLVALDMAGQELWRKRLMLSEGSPDSVSAAPVCVGEIVAAGSDNGVVYAFKQGTGLSAWRLDGFGNIRGALNRICKPHAWDESVVCLSQPEGDVALITAADGRLIHRAPGGGRSDAQPSVAGALVLHGDCTASIRMFSAATQSPVGPIELGEGNEVTAGICVTNDLGFVGTRAGQVVAISLRRQAALWKRPTGAGGVYTTPATDGLVVVAACEDGVIVCLNAADGSERWKTTLEPQPRGPVIAGGKVVVAAGGVLTFLRLADGSKTWSQAFTDELTAPAIVDGRVLVGGSDGVVRAIGAASGN